MLRLVVLGPGGSGKSTFARSLGTATDILPIELDKYFWSADLKPTPREHWIEIQEGLVQNDAWIIDGDLGPYDALEVRLRAANTVVVLDLPTWICAWRSLRRSRERIDFWRWLLTWRRRYRPQVMRAIEEHAPDAQLFMVHNRQEFNLVIDELSNRRE